MPANGQGEVPFVRANQHSSDDQVVRNPGHKYQWGMALEVRGRTESRTGCNTRTPW